ncbi:MAG: class I SAM-dependent methyltransferase [Cyclobacteriaceae bacterium]
MNEPISYEAYQFLADYYSEIAPTKDYNAYYDRPAILSLLDPIEGKEILDAGCGPGIYSDLLTNMGAHIIGIDISENMIKLAKEKNGLRCDFIIANLEEPLNIFENEKFDGIVSALAISYVEDLNPLFSEFHRILKPGGWIVFSTEHPFWSFSYHKLNNYFSVQKVECEWKGFDQKVTMKSYFHNLTTITNAILESKLTIERILEPLPDKKFGEINAKSYEKLQNFPGFIHFKVRRHK